MKIIFAGTPRFSITALAALYNSEHQVIAVYTQPDRRAGRGQRMQKSAVKLWAEEHNIPTYQPLNFKSDGDINTLKQLKPDLMVVIAYGLILPESVLNIPQFGCVNVHASLLPALRGASPIQHAILHGDTTSGVTIMQMDAGMDTGDMYIQEACPIAPSDTSLELHDKIAAISAIPLLKTINDIASGAAKREPQNNANATYAPKINKKDALINWENPANIIARQIRAFYPWPIAYTMADGEMVRIHKAKLISKKCNEAPGLVVSLDKNGLLLSTGENYINILRLQFPGGKTISVADWLNANRTPIQIGFQFS